MMFDENILDVSMIEEGYSTVIHRITCERPRKNHMLDRTYIKLRYIFFFYYVFLSYAVLGSMILGSMIGRTVK